MRLALRFARRELRSGIRGFRIFLACLALGVAALAASGSVGAAFRAGLAAQSRTILGGDLAVSLHGRRFTPDERAAFARLGRTTDLLHVRAMAEGPKADGGVRHLAEIRGVDRAYPLVGHVSLRGADTLAQAFAPVDGVPGAAVDPQLLARLHLHLGDRFVVGDVPLVARAVLLSEPDTLSQGFALGPAILVDNGVLARSGLVAADALSGDHLLIALRPDVTLAAAIEAARQATGGAARIRDRTDAAGGLRRVIDQVEFFLGFIGLSALLAGGVGVSTAVTAYLETRRSSIAILKALGASGALVRDVYLLQLAALTLAGIAVGLSIGAAAPFLLASLLGPHLPIPAAFGVYPGPLLEAGAFGAMAAACFGLGPLARARVTPPASLFRRAAGPSPGFGVERLAQGLAALGLAGLTIATAPRLTVAAGMIAAVAIAFALLVGIGRLAVRLSRRLQRLTRGPVRLGLANLAGPASAARLATPAIGIGVGLLAALLLVQSSLLAAVTEAAPRAAPSLILTGIAASDADTVDAIVAHAIGPLDPDRYRRMPFLTGRIVGIDPGRVAPRSRWAFDQDIGLTSIGAAPPDADLTAGRWWRADYDGPPEIVLDRDIARSAGLAVGSKVSLSVLGRTLETRIAALRRTDFGRFGTSFPLILDPAAIAGANPREIALIRTTADEDRTIVAALGRRLPDVTVISVREQLVAIAKVFGQLAWATRGAASVTGLAGLLVLVGAISSTSRARAREAAILKVLGASRAQIVGATLLEYGAVGLIAATAGVLVGIACAWPVVVLALHSPWRPAPGPLLLLLLGSGAVCAAGGLGGALVAIGRPPAPILRAP